MDLLNAAVLKGTGAAVHDAVTRIIAAHVAGRGTPEGMAFVHRVALAAEQNLDAAAIKDLQRKGLANIFRGVHAR